MDVESYINLFRQLIHGIFYLHLEAQQFFEVIFHSFFFHLYIIILD